MKVVELSGGVGGARMGRGLAAAPGIDLTVVVNIGDDLPTHGLYVSPDLDTVIYTLAGVEGPEGWGRSGDSFVVNSELGRFGVDNRFRLGDLDLALKIFRTERLAAGAALSEVARDVAASFGLRPAILPASNEPVRTTVTTSEGLELSFQEYFVHRGHRDRVDRVAFLGADRATPAPGVLEAIEGADVVVIGPSNPPLSIWPILAVTEIDEAVRRHAAVVAVSPLIGGRTLRGPADRVMADLGLGTGTAAVLSAYQGVIQKLVVDETDFADAGTVGEVEVIPLPTRIAETDAAVRLAEAILSL